MKRAWLLAVAALFCAGCAGYKIAHFAVNSNAVRPLGKSEKRIACVIDTEYLDSKFLDFFNGGWDPAALRSERQEFVAKVKDKIRGSLPANYVFLDAFPTEGTRYDKILKVVPVIRVSVMEEEGRVNVITGLRGRVYDSTLTRTATISVRSSVDESYAGSFKYVGAMEYYKTFMWDQALVDVMTRAINQGLNKTVMDFARRAGELG